MSPRRTTFPVPRPLIVNTSSTGIKNAFSISRLGCGTCSSTAAINFMIACAPNSPGSPSNALSALPRMIGISSPGNS